MLSSVLFSSQEPFHDAVEKGDLARVKQMINSSNISSIRIVRYWGGKAEGYMNVSPLSVACMYENFEIARWLMDQGSDPNGREGSYDSPLWWVAFKGQRRLKSSSHKEYIAMAEELMKKGADPNFNKVSFNGSPLMEAAGSNDVEMVRLMLRYGGDPKVVLYKEHGNAADYAERGGHIELANELRGQSSDDYKRSLIYAVKNNDLSRIKEILSGLESMEEKKNLINKQEEKSLNTALYYTAKLGYLDAAEILVENGADINIESLGSFTPLHTAAAYGNTKVAIYLVNQGANINVVQSSGCATGYTAFNWAIEKNNLELLRAMRSKNADPYAGRIHPLVQARTMVLVKLLVEEYNIKPTQNVLDTLEKAIKNHDKQYDTYYENQKKIYNYLLHAGTVSSTIKVSSSLKGKDTSYKHFEPFDINDEASVSDKKKKRR